MSRFQVVPATRPPSVGTRAHPAPRALSVPPVGHIGPEFITLARRRLGHKRSCLACRCLFGGMTNSRDCRPSAKRSAPK